MPDFDLDNLHTEARRALAGAATMVSAYDKVIHCGPFTLGLHPDGAKREAGENALIDWRKVGGEVIAEDEAGSRLIYERGELRTLGAVGRALLDVSRPMQPWMAGFRALASEAIKLEDTPGGPSDADLRLGLAMRAVALRQMGEPGTFIDYSRRQPTPRPGDVGAIHPDDFERAMLVAHLQLGEDERASMAADAKKAAEQAAFERRLERNSRDRMAREREHRDHCRSLYCRQCGMR